NEINGLRLGLSVERSRVRQGVFPSFEVTVRKVDPAAPVFAPLERTDQPIDRTSLSVRHFLEAQPRVWVSNSPADAEVVIVQLSGDPVEKFTLHSCGAPKVKLTRVTKVLKRGPRDEVIGTQKLRIDNIGKVRLPPGRYEAHVIYRARDNGAKEDLRSNV